MQYVAVECGQCYCSTLSKEQSRINGNGGDSDILHHKSLTVLGNDLHQMALTLAWHVFLRFIPHHLRGTLMQTAWADRGRCTAGLVCLGESIHSGITWFFILLMRYFCVIWNINLSAINTGPPGSKQDVQSTPSGTRLNDSNTSAGERRPFEYLKC